MGFGIFYFYKKGFPLIANCSLDDLSLFLKIIEIGSISKTAEKLCRQKSFVSRRLAHLESTLGLRLFERKKNRLSLTRYGKLLQAEYAPIFKALADTEQRIQHQKNAISGPIQLSIPVNLSNSDFMLKLYAFLQHYPDVQLNVNLLNHSSDMAKSDFDVAFMIDTFDLPDPTYIARGFYKIESGLFASAEFLAQHRPITQVEQLTQLPCITSSKSRYFKFDQCGETVKINVSGPLSIDNSIAQKKVAIYGLGIFKAPVFTVQSALDSGELVPVKLNLNCSRYMLYLVYKERDLMPRKVRYFINHVLEIIRLSENEQ